jgi:hypothetical protein
VIAMIAAKGKWIDGRKDLGIHYSDESQREAFKLLDNSPEAKAARKAAMHQPRKRGSR